MLTLLPMFTPVYLSLPMCNPFTTFTHDYLCLVAFTSVYHCLVVHFYLYFPHINSCLHVDSRLPTFTLVYSCLLMITPNYSCLSMFTQ